MVHKSQMVADPVEMIWQMPIVMERYDRSPLTAKEKKAIAWLNNDHHRYDKQSKRYRKEQNALQRLGLPLKDVFRLRHRESADDLIHDMQLIMRRGMYQYDKVFWEWSTSEWIELLCPTSALFNKKHGRSRFYIRSSIMDAAYLLGNISDLRHAGIGSEIAETANIYFGADLVTRQCQTVLETLMGKGYGNGKQSIQELRRCLSNLFVLNRSPFLEAVSEQLLASTSEESVFMRRICGRVGLGLQHLGILPARRIQEKSVPHTLESNGMAKEWTGLWPGMSGP